MTPIPSRSSRPGPGRSGSTLVEVMIVTLLVGVFAAMAIPSYRTSVEQARTDLAAANLRTLWAAERLYYLEQRTATADPADLIALGVLQSGEIQSLGVSGTFTMYNDPTFIYQLDSNNDGYFDAIAVRSSGSAFSGTLGIDATGSISGEVIDNYGRVVRPGFR